jgi:DNA-binding transcriptional regulator YiaG
MIVKRNAMTGQQYGAAIAKLGLSQRSAAKFLHVSERTSRYWIADARPVPHAVKLLLNLMIAKEIKPEDLI